MAPGNFDFDPRAYFDEKDGMYKMPEADNTIDAFKDASGIWLPKPTGKEVTRIIWDLPGIATECSETPNEVVAKFNGTGEWVELTNPVIGVTIRLNRLMAKKHCFILDTVYKDMEIEKMNVQAFELNKRNQAAQIDQARFQNVLSGKNRRGAN